MNKSTIVSHKRKCHSNSVLFQFKHARVKGYQTRSTKKPTSRLVDLTKKGDWKGASTRITSHPKDIHWINSLGFNVLHAVLAFSKDIKSSMSLEFLRKLITTLPELVVEQTSHKWTSFHFACHRSDTSLELLKMLLRAIDELAVKKVHTLCLRIPDEVIRNCILPYLDEAKEVLIVQDDRGETAVHMIVPEIIDTPLRAEFFLEKLQLLLNVAPRSALSVNCDGKTPVHRLCQYYLNESEIPTLSTLVNHIPSEAFQLLGFRSGGTPLHHALQPGPRFTYPRITPTDLRLLIEANPSALLVRDGCGLIPLDFLILAQPNPNDALFQIMVAGMATIMAIIGTGE